MRGSTTGSLALVTLLLLAGCGGGSDRAGGAAGHVPGIGVGDLATIASVPPPLPAVARYDEIEEGDIPSVFTLATIRSIADTPDERALVSALEDSKFERAYQRKWAGHVDDTGISPRVSLFLFRDESGTSDVLAVFRRSLRDETGGSTFAELDASGLGDEAYGGHGSDDESFVDEHETFVYAWRSRNVVATAYLTCARDCDNADYAEAARAYADAIDARIGQAG